MSHEGLIFQKPRRDDQLHLARVDALDAIINPYWAAHAFNDPNF
jgi:hypothetical protein